jgi:DNA-binding NarL/FixJ family response regulator
VIITDISMPNLNGLNLLTQIKSENESIKIIVFTMHEETEYMHASIERGADGYLLKNSDLDELSKAIEAVYAGKCFYSEQLSNSIASVIRNKNSRVNPDVQLSPRELEVLSLIVAGQSNKMVSHELSISDKTVAIHRSNIMRKVNAKNSADLVRIAIENNILKPKLALI